MNIKMLCSQTVCFSSCQILDKLLATYLTNRENGLKIWKDESTRDIICLEFNFGSRSYEEEIKHLKDLGRKSRLEYKLARSRNYKKQIDRQYNKRKKIATLFQEAKNNKDNYQKYSKEEIRRIFYNDGVNVE